VVLVRLKPTSPYFLHFKYEPSLYVYKTMVCTTSWWEFKSRGIFERLHPEDLELLIETRGTRYVQRLKAVRIRTTSKVKRVIFKAGWPRNFTSVDAGVEYDKYNKFWFVPHPPPWFEFYRAAGWLCVKVVADDFVWDTGWFGMTPGFKGRYYLRPWEKKWVWSDEEPQKSFFAPFIMIWRAIMGADP